MTNSHRGRHAVLTGDLINSSKLTSAELAKVREALSRAVDDFQFAWPDVVIGELDFFRGDSWQLLMGAPANALRLALLIRTSLRAQVEADTRISIGIGRVDNIEHGKISLSTGEAFTLSGRALDDMGNYFQLTAAVSDGAGPIVDWVPLTFQLCGAIMRTWTRRQSEIVGTALMMKNPEHEEIANALTPPVAKQTVTKSLLASNWRALVSALKAFERADWNAWYMQDLKQPD